MQDPLVKELLGLLIDWINDELADERIIVKNIEEDLYDGQVLHKLWEKLSKRKLDVPEVTQSEEGQRQKLLIVLTAVNHVRNSNRSQVIGNSVIAKNQKKIFFLNSDPWLPSKSAKMECGKCAFKKYGGNSSFACRTSSTLPCTSSFARKCLRHYCHCPKERHRFERTVSLNSYHYLR